MDGGTIAYLLKANFGSVFILRLTTPDPSVQRLTLPQREVDIDIFANVLKYIKRLNPMKSPGMDGNHPFVVKSFADTFSEVLSTVSGRSFSCG